MSGFWMNNFPFNGFLQIMGFESVIVGVPIWMAAYWKKNRKRAWIGGVVFLLLGIGLMSF